MVFLSLLLALFSSPMSAEETDENKSLAVIARSADEAFFVAKLNATSFKAFQQMSLPERDAVLLFYSEQKVEPDVAVTAILDELKTSK